LVPGGVGTKANFGFNVKYNKSGQNLQGAINIIVRNGARVYQIKGTAMTSLSTSGNKGTFNGKANIQDITDPLAPLSLDGNATLQVKMSDNGSPGSSDTLTISVWNKSGGVWFASNWDGTKTIEQVLGGGNLVVRSSSGGGNFAPAALASPEPSPNSAPIALAIRLVPTSFNMQHPLAADAPRLCEITFQVRPATDYELEYSTDLVTWSRLEVVASYTGTLIYFDEAPLQGLRFYRAKEIPSAQ
jgi:hypothetical protein